MKALDLFAGSGVGVATRKLGIEEFGVEIWQPAIDSRAAAGFNTPYRDAWDVDAPERLGIEFDILWASPPCQTFSVAGKGAGRESLDAVIGAIQAGRWADIESLRTLGDEVGDQRTALVIVPLTYTKRYRPTYVALEQVPTVLPVWEAYRAPLESLGYSVWIGHLNSEEYGVPQARKRAYLIARRDGIEAGPPTPMNAGYRGSHDSALPVPVTMHEALGWGITDRPHPGITSHLGVTRSPTGTQQVYQSAIDRGAFEFKDVAPIASKVAVNGIGSRYAPNTINLNDRDGAIIAGYPEDFPFKGTKTQRHLQIGNSVPPPVAEAVLKTFLTFG